MVRHGERYLHHNFVVTLLNDLFGIQTRGGCSCAGPYGHRLLGIDLVHSQAYEREILRGCEGIKPGWTRINFNYFISMRVFEFLLDAIEFVAEHGWRFLPLYRFVPESGLWHHHAWNPEPRLSLMDFRFEGGRHGIRQVHPTAGEDALEDYLRAAHELVAQLPKQIRAMPSTPPTHSLPTRDYESLRWFPLPEEILSEE
jgi:hypothetical protein